MEKEKKNVKTYSEDLKEYLQKIAEKQIPVKNKDFRKEILKIRRKWKIPLQGFKNKKSVQKWLCKPPHEILKYPKVVEQTEREILNLGNSGRIVKELNPKIIEGIKAKKDIGDFPIGSFLTDIEIFMTESGIDHALIKPFLNFLYYDRIKKAPYPRTIIEASEKVVYTKSRKKVSHLINVTLGPNTRRVDILEVWNKFIAPLQEKLPGYQGEKGRRKKPYHKVSS